MCVVINLVKIWLIIVSKLMVTTNIICFNNFTQFNK